MKKTIFILSIIALITTFIFAETFSIYHFGTPLTVLTTLYLISLFAILLYLLFFIVYIIRKSVKKEKIEIKKIISLVLLFVSLLLILSFIITINVDHLHWYFNSSPFYVNVIVRSIEFLLPSIIFIIISMLLKNNKRTKK